MTDSSTAEAVADIAEGSAWASRQLALFAVIGIAKLALDREASRDL